MPEEFSAAQEGAEVEAAAPAVIEAPEGDEPETPDEPDEVADGEEGEAEVVEEIEFDFGGNKKKWPKGTPIDQIADEISQFTKGTWSDYTRKSQEVAERAKSVEARESAVEKLVSLNNETLDTYSRGLQIKQELAQLDAVDLNAMWQSNPDQARRVSDLKAQKQAEFQSVVSKVSQQEQALTQAQHAEIARRMDEGRTIADKIVKGFSEKAPEVVEYVVKNFGMTKQEAETWPLNPKTAIMAYKAMQFDKMQASAKKAAQVPVKEQEAPVVSQKSKGGSAIKDPAKMSVSELAEYLRKPLR